MKLYELPRYKGVKIYGLKGLDDQPVVVIFGHLDGMYSYCWIEGQEDKIVHLNASMPLKPYKDGYEVADEDND